MDCNDDPIITLSPSGKQFSARQHNSVLESGLAAGITLPYRCSNGSCGDCRARILHGHTERMRPHDYVLTQAEKNSNVVLLCSHRALTNLEIEVTEATTAEDIPEQQINTRICHTERDNNHLIVRLKILRGKALRYLAGQYATLNLPELPAFMLPVASCPCETGYLEFHLGADSAAIQQAIESLPKRTRIVVSGPHGNFTINDRELQSHHHVFIAGEQHFSVIKPMIEHVITTELEPDCTLIRLSSAPYKHNLCRSWCDAFDNFSYHCIDSANQLNELLLSRSLPIKAYISADSQTCTSLQSVPAFHAIPKVICDHFARQSATPQQGSIRNNN